MPASVIRRLSCARQDTVKAMFPQPRVTLWRNLLCCTLWDLFHLQQGNGLQYASKQPMPCVPSHMLATSAW